MQTTKDDRVIKHSWYMYSTYLIHNFHEVLFKRAEKWYDSEDYRISYETVSSDMAGNLQQLNLSNMAA